MGELRVVRLLSMALRTGLESLHDELSRSGFPELRPPHGYALNAISGGERTVSQLAVRLGMTKQGAARVVQLLLDEGYVVQTVDPDDARNRPLDLTRRGRDAVATSMKIQSAIEKRWQRHVGAADMRTLMAGLEAIVRQENDGELPPVRPGW